MSAEDKIQSTLTTLDGGTDFSKTDPTDLLSVGGTRRVLLAAGDLLDSKRQPIRDMPEGVGETLGGNVALKLGHEVIIHETGQQR